MSYSTSIPNASDPRAQSQSQLLANFQALNSVWAVNHSNLTGDAPQGRHDVLTIRSQTVDPTTSASQVALYNKVVSSIPELFFRPKSNGTPIQLTYPSCTNGVGAQQQSFIAGPFVIYAGFLTNSTGIPQGTVVTLSPSSNLKYVSVNQSNASVTGLVSTGVCATSVNSPMSTFTVSFITNLTLKIPVLYYFAIGQ